MDPGSSGCLVLDSLLVFPFRLALGGLWTAARTFGQGCFDLLDGLGLGNALHDRDLTRQPVERRLIELALRVRLLGLGLRTEEIADNLCDRDDVTGIDLG